MDIRMSNIASPMPQIRAKFTNKLGIPLAGCKVYTYEPNSGIPKTTWLDTDQTVENTNPILLDAAGEADIFLDGLYRVVVKDRFGFVVYDVEKTGSTQQDINDFGGAKWRNKAGGYALGATVKLDNGDIVKSAINGNTNNPNVNMTGWLSIGNIGEVESIADLLVIQNPKNGSRVSVKSYHAGLNKGGGTFIYDSSKSGVNDGVFFINGWLRKLESNVCSVYISGCRCDGVTDDTERFDNLQYAIEVSNIKGLEILFEGELLINSELPMRGNTQYLLDKDQGVKYGMRLLSNTKYNLARGSKLKFGSYFNDSKCILIWGGVLTSAQDWLPLGTIDNFEFTGGGSIDLSETGVQESSHLSPRMVFGCYSTPNSNIHDIVIEGGDITNLVVTRRLSENFHVYNCKFIDTYKDNTKSSDHTAIYLGGVNSSAYNNYFKLSSVKGLYNSTAIELHQSGEKAYNNICEGYKTFCISAAYYDNYCFDSNIPISERIVSNEVYNNQFTGVFFISFWGDGKINFGTVKAYENTHYAAKAITASQFSAAGLQPKNQVCAFVFSNTPDSPNGDTPTPTNVNDGIYIYDNTYLSSFDVGYSKDVFYYYLATIKNNMNIYDNVIRAPQVMDFNSSFVYDLIGFNFYKNLIKDTDPKKPVFLVEPITMVNCCIDISFNDAFVSQVTPVHIKVFGNTDASINNTVNIQATQINTLDNWFEGYEIMVMSDFATNKYNFPCKAEFSVFGGGDTYLLQSSSASMPAGTKLFAPYITKASRSNHLVMPSAYVKTQNGWGTTVQGVAHTFGGEVESNTSDLTVVVYGYVKT